MKKIAIMILLMGLSLNVVASIQSIGAYKVLAEGELELTTNSPVANSEVEIFLGLGVNELWGENGSAFKDSFNITGGEVFSFDWTFSTTDTYFDDFSFIDLKLNGNSIFSKKILGQSSAGNTTGQFLWEATGTGILSYGIGILNVGDNLADSSIAISNINPVPLPAAAWLFLTGLLGLAGFKQKRSAI